MLRYSTINTLGGVDMVHTSDPVQVVGRYVVDDSSFVPLKEAVKNVTTGAITPEMARRLYDYPDGKDDGSKVPVDRTHSFYGDIAEISQIARERAADVRADFVEYVKDKQFQDRLDAINGSGVENLTSSSAQQSPQK